MRRLALAAFAATLGALLFAVVASPAAVAANMAKRPPPLDLKPGQELAIPIWVVDGRVTTGAPRASKLGTSQPRDGEILVGLEREAGTLYNHITVVETTAQPINFLVTGLNGGTKIDETEICGRLDAPVAAHIGSIPWRFWLNGFEVGKGAGTCQ